MTYGEFVAAVIEELGPDGTRRGIEALRTRSIRDAVLDLQRFIRAFRTGHTTTYQEADLEVVGYTHVGELPAQAKPKAFYIVSTGETVKAGTTDNPNIVRNRLDYVAWEDRQAMIDNRRGVRNYQYAISPFSRQFMVHPLINDETYLLVVWDGLKMDFEDADEVPWPEWAAEAVGAYVKWKILVEIDKRLDLAREWYDKARGTGIYPNLRLALYREQQESQSADGKDEEYNVDAMPNPNPLLAFGAQDVPFLKTVTQLEGTDNTALSYIATVGITPNYAVMFLNANTALVETWVLRAGTDATDGVSVQRPNDYNASTNAKVWYKQT